MICVFLVSSCNAVTLSCITIIHFTPIAAVLLQSQFEKQLQTIENADCSCLKQKSGLQSCDHINECSCSTDVFVRYKRESVYILSFISAVLIIDVQLSLWL